MLALLWCNLALLLAASVLAFPTAELACAMQHGSHGGTISALLLHAVASAAMLVFHARGLAA
jgi:hypothetical protein